jgi:L-cysteine/cystine lyase
MDVAALRSELPALERVVYLNAGSVGPAPRGAIAAAEVELHDQLEAARGGGDHFTRAITLAGRLRARVAALLGCDPWEVALTGAATDGINAVVGGLELGPGEVILTSDEEHPGLLAPLALARERRGVELRIAPFAEIASAVGPRTRLIACSHVSWISGRIVDAAALASTGVPVLLDGAQGLGAIDVDVRALGCDYYAASGQKWLCGPIGSGYLYVRERALESLAPIAPGYSSLSDPGRPLDLPLADGAARLDRGVPPTHQAAWSLAAIDVLADAGLAALYERAARLAHGLAEQLAATGLTVVGRDASTLVSWEARDPELEAARLHAAGFLVRQLPGTPHVRAAVGAWNTTDELERLAETATSTS